MGLPTIVDSIEITQEHREAALELAKTNHGDADMGRDSNEQLRDTRVGMLGEIVALEMLEQTDGLTLEEPTDNKCDVIMNGHRTEVKSRKTWERSEPDLLVRKKFDLSADLYIQVDLHSEDDSLADPDLSNVVRGEFVGYVTKDEVESLGEEFNPDGKVNDTVIIYRQHLDPLHKMRAMIV